VTAAASCQRNVSQPTRILREMARLRYHTLQIWFVDFLNLASSGPEGRSKKFVDKYIFWSLAWVANDVCASLSGCSKSPGCPKGLSGSPKKPSGLLERTNRKAAKAAWKVLLTAERACRGALRPFGQPDKPSGQSETF